MKPYAYFLLLLVSCQQSHENQKTTSSENNLISLIQQAEEVEKNFNLLSEINSDHVDKLIQLSEEIISNYPKDSLAGKYYLKLNVLYIIKDEKNKSIETGELFLKNCSTCLDNFEKKIILENLVLSYEELHDTTAIKRIYNHLLSMPHLKQEDSLGYVSRIDHIELNLDDFIKLNLQE